MLISQETSLSQLPSNDFDITYQRPPQLYLQFDLTIFVNSLSLSNLPQKHFELLELIWDLSENKNMSNKEISDYLNQNGYKTIRGNSEFYPKLIWSILKKYRKRKSRKDNNYIYKIKESLYMVRYNKK